MASVMLTPPTRQHTTGFAARAAAATTCCATSFTGVMACGTNMAIAISTPGSARMRSSAALNISARGPPSISTGLPSCVPAGVTSLSFACVSGVKSAILRPTSSSPSAASAAGPPALVSSATRGPAGSG